MKIAIATAVLTALMATIFSEAHITVVPPVIPPNSYTAISLRVPHGCDGAGTIKLIVTLPTNTSSVKPQLIPNWTSSTTLRPLDPPFVSEGKVTNTTVDKITWTADTPAGGNASTAGLPDTNYLDFGITFKSPIKSDNSSKIFFIVNQVCTNTTVNWTDTSAGAEDPAPSVNLSDSASPGAKSAAASTTPDNIPTLTMTAILLALAVYGF